MTNPLTDVAQVLAQARAGALDMASLDFHTGQVIAWDSDNDTNTILVLGTLMENLPVLTSAGITSFQEGVSVGILRVRTQYFILGRVVDQNSGLVNPLFPIVLYPLFNSNGTPGTAGAYRLNAGVLAQWEGRIRVAFPFIEVDGIWGNFSGTGDVTYELRVNSVVVGSWTESGLVVVRRGPFDVRQFLGMDWLAIVLAITASTGAGEKAFQPLGCYFINEL